MRIGILGAGTMGTALARAFARNSHRVLLASRERSRALAAAARAGGGVEGALPAEAVSFADVAVLATRWQDTEAMLGRAGSFSGRVLVDATNPEAAEGYALAVGHTTSGAEEIARWARDARVVKAFNAVYAEVLEAGPVFGSERASLFYCGGDVEAKEVVARLASEFGFDPVDAGGLENARLLEPAAALMVQLVRVQGHAPRDIALKLLHRD